MKKIQIAFVLSLLACLLFVPVTGAQSNQLTLKMSRDWGYGGFNGDIQGLFTMHVTGPSDLAKVTFYIDTTVIGTVDKAPFNLQFKTDNYGLGVHQIHAVGTSAGGQEYISNVVQAEFVAASKGFNTVIPILVIVLAAVVISTAVPLLIGRKGKNTPMGAERNYGMGGGAICPKCHRPFALGVMTPHLGFAKVAVCPYCKKLSLVRPEPLEKLREAEKAELGSSQATVPEENEEDKLKKEMDDSKYQGM